MPEILDAAHANHLQGKSGGGNQTRFHAALRADELGLVPGARDLSRHRNRRNDVPSCAPPAITKGHPACSDTFIRIPSDTSVTSRELPPKLIIGSGNPFVGKIPSTTLILKKACTTRSVVIPSAR